MRRDMVWLVSLVTIATAMVASIYFYNLCGGLSVSKIISCHKPTVFFEFYSKNLRGSLFAGFLTLGGFLMSLKTFIVVNMKKEVFDKPEYLVQWQAARKNNPNTEEFKYAPLRFLASTIFIAIVSCISTATAQLTIGLVPSFWTALICMWASAVSIAIILRSLILIRKNLNRMFDYLDDEQRETEKSKF